MGHQVTKYLELSLMVLDMAGHNSGVAAVTPEKEIVDSSIEPKQH